VGRPEALVQKGSWITTYDVGLRIAGMIPIWYDTTFLLF
jgi:hypothetical protein